MSDGGSLYLEDPRSGKTLNTLAKPQAPETLDAVDLRTWGRMGKGKAELFLTSNKQVLATWPRVWGAATNRQKTIMAVVVSQGVVLVDVKKSASTGRLVTL